MPAKPENPLYDVTENLKGIVWVGPGLEPDISDTLSAASSRPPAHANSIAKNEKNPAGSTFADAHLPKEGAASEPYLPQEGGSVSSAGHSVSLAKRLSCVKAERS